MVGLRTLARLFAPAPACGPLCRAVGEEIETMRLADDLRRLAVKCTDQR